MKIPLQNFSYGLQAPQTFIYSKTDIGGTIPQVSYREKLRRRKFSYEKIIRRLENISSLFPD